MAAIMLIELWEKIRGYDKWRPVEAKILSSKLDDVQVLAVPDGFGRVQTGDEWQSTCGISWTDANGKEHQARFKVSEDSPLFQLYDGQTLEIRYNPENPDQFYQRGVAHAKLMMTLKWTIGPVILGAVFLALWLYKMFSSSPGQ
jgi:uncharacterized protein DUF3592